jgi:hypothetical protein
VVLGSRPRLAKTQNVSKYTDYLVRRLTGRSVVDDSVTTDELLIEHDDGSNEKTFGVRLGGNKVSIRSEELAELGGCFVAPGSFDLSDSKDLGFDLEVLDQYVGIILGKLSEV